MAGKGWDYGWCKVCGRYGRISEHRCPPVWHVWPEGETEDDARDIRADDAQEAAERWAAAEDIRGADYSIVGGSSAQLFVRASTGGETKLFEVTGYPEPVYQAQELVSTAPHTGVREPPQSSTDSCPRR